MMTHTLSALLTQGVYTLTAIHATPAIGVMLLGIGFCLLLTSPVWAQHEPPSSELPRLPTLTIEERRPTSEREDESSSSTVLEREMLARTEERDVRGVFRGLPGVNQHIVGNRGQLSLLLVRGVSSGLGQLVFDGIPLYSSASNLFNLATLQVGALERIEVVRGASSPRYGSRALGGVILLTSREARQDGAFLHLEGGSYGTLSETAGISLVGARARASATISRDDILADISAADRRNGNREGDNFQTTQGVARLTARPFDRLTIDSSVLYTSSRADIDRGGVLPTGQIGRVDDLDAFAREERLVAQSTAHGRVLPGWESRLQLGLTHSDASGMVVNMPFGFDNRLFLARWSNTQQLVSRVTANNRAASHLEFVWGLELQDEKGKNRFNLPDRLLHGTRQRLSGLLELRGAAGPWSGIIGSSIDHYDDRGTHPTLYTGLSYAATSALTLRLAGGRGYRPPALHELFFVPLLGNPNLDAERSWNTELGLEWFPQPGTRLSITGYYQRFHDLIQLALASGPALFVTGNIPQARIQGVEIAAVHSWGHGVTTGIDYTYTDSRDLDADRDLPQRPHHQSRAYAAWQLRTLPLAGWLSLVYRGSYFSDSQKTLHVGDSFYLNAQVSYRLSPHLRFYLRGENLTNDRTPEIFSFGTRGAAGFAGVHLSL